MSKKRTIVQLKVKLLRDVKRRSKSCFELLNSWCDGYVSDKKFAIILMKHLEVLDDSCDSLIERSTNYGVLEAEQIAKLFHKVYEELAPKYKYSTRPASRVEWGKLPKNHRDLMVATVKKVLARISTSDPVHEKKQ